MNDSVGISGFAAYLPRYRVPLEDWCRWTGDSWSKVSSVIGTGFRMCAPNENAYTMAATAVVRLIRRYDVDPSAVGFLGLGTESSTDNSAGAVIVKGMVDDALRHHGLPALSRRCEVPEFKHACLGGVYALKAAGRYLATDGAGRKAIVVCTDVAEYARGTTGEPTQGAGAVAMLLETDPTLLTVELAAAGSASDYRGVDFRKPFQRFVGQTPTPSGQVRDFPVFNGRYSTTCYVEEVLRAAEHLFSKLQGEARDFLEELRAVFLHRPYQRMAETGLVMAYLLGLAVGDEPARTELERYADAASVAPDAVIAELIENPNVYGLVENGRLDDELFPSAMAVARAFRSAPDYRIAIADKLRLGSGSMREVGNLYTASLPAWMAAGLEEAALEDANLGEGRILAIGYGSGDAAEAIPMRAVPGWKDAATRIDFSSALAAPVDLSQTDYERLHAGQLLLDPADDGADRPDTFVVERIGSEAHFHDDGVEYYRYVG